MRKMKLVSLLLAGCMVFTACSKSDDSDKKQAADANVGENNDGSDIATEGMVWFPKSAKAVSEDGTVLASIETEYDDGKLVYKYVMNYPDYNMERYYGFEIEYDKDSITKYYELRGNRNSEKDTVTKTEMVIEYTEGDDVLYVNDMSSEYDRISVSREHRYTFDSDGKVIERNVAYVEYSYDEDGQLTDSRGDDDVNTYKYEYVTDGYYVIYDYEPWDMLLATGEEVECTKRETTFIPYDKTKGHTKVITYHLANGDVATLAEDEWYDVYCDNSQKTEAIYNNKGYLIEINSYLADGSKVTQDLPWKCEYNDANNVKNYIGYDEDGNVTSKGDFTYDKNGNITAVEIEYEGEKVSVEIEWMQVPECIDTVNQLIYGHDKYAISELIEEVIPETDVIDLQDTYYTRDMLEELK